MLIWLGKYRSIFRSYYKKIIRPMHYWSRLFIPVRRVCVDVEYQPSTNQSTEKTDIVTKGTEFVVVLKPCLKMKRSIKIAQVVIEKFGARIIARETVQQFGQMIKVLYQHNSQISQMVAELYNSERSMLHRAGTVFFCEAKADIDLISLKTIVRRKIGYHFFIIYNVWSKIEILVGLNGVHIPDAKSMIDEEAIIRTFLNKKITI